MKLNKFAILALVTGTAATLLKSDELVAQGLSNLEKFVAENGYPSPETCTWDKVVRRQEWCVWKKAY
jgi:tyrosinase